MRLLVDTRNGIAGDIMSAGLIGLGAEPDAVCGAMETAGSLMGQTRVSHIIESGIHRLHVNFESPGHLHAAKAKEYLNTALDTAGIARPWSGMATQVLDVMIEAEGRVHSEHPSLRRHFHGPEPVLHEASDIIMDITGMAAGMMALDITALGYLDRVNVGGGKVIFSHGTLDVPTPATRYILDSRSIPWCTSDLGMESATPTGVSMLAGCGAVRFTEEPPFVRKSLAGGTRPLPPVAFILHSDRKNL
ncbi:MAG: DUF111 family protein [Thermoplasmata archaeon]|nr:DUF111 family protein [Thermoplasmata archaeon]